MPVAGPLLMTGGSLLGGLFGSRKSAEEKAAEKAQMQSMGNLTKAGGEAMGMAKDQYSLASPAYGQAMSYYSRLLGGNRALAAQATAAPQAQITDIYRGAERGLDRGMVRGGARNLASAELNRDRAGKLSSLVTGVQPMAAENLSSLASEGFSNAQGFMATGINAYGGGANVASNIAQRARERQQQQNAMWSGIGKNIFDIWGPKIMNWNGWGGKQPSSASAGGSGSVFGF